MSSTPQRGVTAQSRAIDIDIGRLELSHPKNYLGVPLAVAAAGDTGGLIMAHLVGMAGRAKAGAESLGLLDAQGDITARGHRVVIAAERYHGGPADALEVFEELSGSPKRFIDAVPEWTPVLREAIGRRPPINTLLKTVDERGGCTLSELVRHLAVYNPDLADEFRGDESPPAWSDGADLTDPSWYRGAAIFQMKSLCYHAGLLTERGKDTHSVEPTCDRWETDFSWGEMK